jgi:hypothetical protein
MKILSDRTAERRARFGRERFVMKTIKHPNVAEALEYGTLNTATSPNLRNSTTNCHSTS